MKSAKGERRAERVIVALLENNTLDKAAASLGIFCCNALAPSSETGGSGGISEARWDAFSQSIARLQQASSAAVSTLLRVMVDKDSPAASRVRAADCVLDHAANAFELEELEARLNRLEQMQENK